LNAVLFALVAGLIWGLDAHHDRAAGVCMGLLATKPHVGLIVAGVVSLGLIARRRFTPIVWAASTVAVCAGVSFLVSPTWPGDLLASFDAFTARTGFTWPLNGFQDNPTAFAALRVSAGSSSLAFALTMAGLSILAGLSVYRMRRGRHLYSGSARRAARPSSSLRRTRAPTISCFFCGRSSTSCSPMRLLCRRARAWGWAH